ncbi:hypothetical protein [Qipengyuania sp.]|uniref:hypothetical protein n=1 Tax=Qipengyuania sp. TaxID=2004515 RepID=UPI0035180990
MTGLLTHWDPLKFPSLEQMLGEQSDKQVATPVDDAEPRANAAAWIAVMNSWNRKAGAQPTGNIEEQEVDDG